jgi:branched-subunit amino acid transport protein
VDPQMTSLWIATLMTSGICFLLKYLGYSLPESVLNKPVIQRINLLIPIALLSALVAVQTFGSDKSVVIDHRLAGVGAAAIALKFKASFPVIMLVAAVTSALMYRI